MLKLWILKYCIFSNIIIILNNSHTYLDNLYRKIKFAVINDSTPTDKIISCYLEIKCISLGIKKIILGLI